MSFVLRRRPQRRQRGGNAAAVAAAAAAAAATAATAAAAAAAAWIASQGVHSLFGTHSLIRDVPTPPFGTHLLELDEFTPPKEVTQVEIPGCATASKLAQCNHFPLQCAREADHTLHESGRDGGEVVGRDQAHVGSIELLHPHLHSQGERAHVGRRHGRAHQATRNA